MNNIVFAELAGSGRRSSPKEFLMSKVADNLDMLGLKPPRLLPKAWKHTLNLPRTSFPPRGATPAEQARYLPKCTDELYSWQRAQPREEVFTLHDGPPYANGSLHIGHALNKILKDITCRFQLSQGKRVNYVPGWDCHGLPIELKALEKWKKETNVEDSGTTATLQRDPLSVRTAARQLAVEAVEEQKKSFREWGIMADWENAWKTMDKGFEIKQLNVFKRMVMRGLIYRKFKPVYWSPSSQTALAEAELEYRDDHVSTAAFVKFPLQYLPEAVKKKLGSNTQEISALIWTTTPWTLPANKGIGFHSNILYVVLDGEQGRLLIAETRLEEVQKMCNETFTLVATFLGSELAGATYRDVVFDRQSDPRPFLHADFVSDKSGSGLVHLAPGQGKPSEDYELCLSHGISAFAPIDDYGRFTSLATPDEPAVLEEKDILGVGNQAVLERLSSHGRLLAKHKHTHQYPYDWRSKQPVVLRATEQWFANVGDVQEAALLALESVKFVPEISKGRLESFVRNRSEWCISRQRAWGVPIPALYGNQSNEAVLTEASVSHIISIIEERGIDAWWSDEELDPIWTPPYMRETNGQTAYRRGKDTMDVWFDSGTSWTQIPGSQDSDHSHIADVYLEGTDQHRGWFQSSLLTHVAFEGASPEAISRPQAPFRSLVTHGFTLDQHGKKMSKSEGNVVSPDEIIGGTLLAPLKRKINGKTTEFRDAMGLDALRLWVASCDYTKDVVVSPMVLKGINNTLAKYRVTFKLLLGILQDFDPSVEYPSASGGSIHKIAIWQLEKAEATVLKHYQNLEYHKAINEINRYVTTDFSGSYFESVKDVAYCGTAEERIMAQTTLNEIYYRLQYLLAPVTPLLIQETWEHTPQCLQESHRLPPFQRTWAGPYNAFARNHIEASSQPNLLDSERDQLEIDVPILQQVLTAVQNAQESARISKKMGSSLQCFVMLQLHEVESEGGSLLADIVSRYSGELEAMYVTSKVDHCLGKGVPDVVGASEWTYQAEAEIQGTKIVAHIYAPQAEKCVRCWRYAAPVEASKDEAVCERCERVIEDLRKEMPDLF